ncbi:hypothetical protein V8B97DRAFT_1298256 [Scleroderma yunnanense]
MEQYRVYDTKSHGGLFPLLFFRPSFLGLLFHYSVTLKLQTPRFSILFDFLLMVLSLARYLLASLLHPRPRPFTPGTDYLCG